MNKSTILGSVALAALLAAGTSAFAQAPIGGVSGVNPNDVTEANRDLTDAIEDDAERDLDRFGNEGRPEGLSGSFALRATYEDDETDSYDLGFGSDLSYVFGPNGIDFQLNYTKSRTEDDDGDETSDENLIYSLQYNRDLTPRLYGFARVQGSYDDDDGLQTDTFVSVGAGYRVLATAETQWDLQAGLGYRFARFDDISDLEDFDDPAIGVNSDYAQRINDMVLLTNDTDIIYSDDNTVIYNDLAVSMSMTDNMALRTSLLTEYQSDPSDGEDNTENTLGVSVVYSY